MAKLDNSILESSDKDVHPSKESKKGIDTEPTNISEVTEKSAHHVLNSIVTSVFSKELLAKK